MNIRFLETFLCLARLRSLRLTADKLHATPAAITSRIASVESAVGARLFERQAGGLYLTKAGRILLSYAERIVLLERHMHDVAQSRSTGVTTPSDIPRLNVGVTDVLLHSWLPLLKLMRVQVASDPTTPVDLHLVSDSYASMAQMLRSGLLDVMLHVERAVGAEYMNVELDDLPLVWLCSAQMAVSHERMHLQALRHMTWIGGAPFTTLHDILEHALALGLAHVPAIHSVHSLLGVSRMIEEGFGVGILPEPLVAQALSDGRLQRLNVDMALPSLKATATYSASSDPAVHQLVHRLRHALTEARALPTIRPLRGLGQPVAVRSVR